MMTRGVYRLCSNTPRFYFIMKLEFNIGDKVKVIKSNSGYYNFKAIIKKVDMFDGCLPYYCHILDSENNVIDELWLSKKI